VRHPSARLPFLFPCPLRSWDGLTLYAASSDGTIGVFNFDPDELEGIAPHSVQEKYLAKFGFKTPPIPEGYSHTSTVATSVNNATAAGSSNDFSTNGGLEVVHVLIAKKGNRNKKRAKFSGSSVPSASTNGLIPSASAMQQHVSSSSRPSSSTKQCSFPSPAEQLFEPSHSSRDWKMEVDTDTVTDSAPIFSLDGRDPQIRKQKAKSFVRNLSGNVQRNTGISEPITTRGPSAGDVWRGDLDLGLDEPKLMKYQSIKVQDVANEVLKVWNYEDGGELHHACRCNASLMAYFDSGNEDFTSEK